MVCYVALPAMGQGDLYGSNGGGASGLIDAKFEKRTSATSMTYV
jgi:hypothetical protein